VFFPCVGEGGAFSHNFRPRRGKETLLDFSTLEENFTLFLKKKEGFSI